MGSGGQAAPDRPLELGGLLGAERPEEDQPSLVPVSFVVESDHLDINQERAAAGSSAGRWRPAKNPTRRSTARTRGSPIVKQATRKTPL